MSDDALDYGESLELSCQGWQDNTRQSLRDSPSPASKEDGNDSARLFNKPKNTD